MRSILIFLAAFFSLNAFSFKASPYTRISLITASPGPELYSVFGHNALRVQDTSQKIDVFFNYGTFNFNTPNFYLKFTKGILLYQLSIEDSVSFWYTYIMNGQRLQEQVFDLNMQQTQKICDYLENNYKPENRSYRYEFYFDNCATRIRDILYMAYEEKLLFDSTIRKEKITIREMLDPYLDHYPWTHLGVDLVMGLPADQEADVNQEMFLPEYMYHHISKVTHNGKPIVKQDLLLLPEDRTDNPLPFPFKPVFVFWILFIACTSFYFYYKKALPVIQKIWFTLWGLLGVLITFMWFFTEHSATKINLNFFWALPLHLLIWLPDSKFKRRYFNIVVIINILVFVLWILRFYPQGINPAFLPIWAIMIVLGMGIKKDTPS